MPVDKLTFRRTALLMLLIGLITLLGISGMSIWLVQRTNDFAEILTTTQQQRALVSGLRTVLNDAETGQRGFLLTGDEAYLAPYDRARAVLPERLARLADLAASDPAMRGHVDALNALVASKFGELDQTVALARAGQSAKAVAFVRSGRGRILMEDARAVLGELLERLDARLRIASAETVSTSNHLFLVTLIGSALILIVLSSALWLVVRYTRELEQAQNEVRDANARLERRVRERTADLAFANGELAQANEEVQRFAYIVSHDLRAPLVNVMGFTSELEVSLDAIQAQVAHIEQERPDLVLAPAKLAVTEDLPEAVSFIRSSTDRMDRLINAILRISREGRRGLNPERISMAELFQTLAASIQHQVAAAGAVIEVDPDPPEIVSDRLALEQIFGNLIDNAIKYLDPQRSGQIVIRGRREGERLVYEVEDNGRGIASADRERVFELFRRAGRQDQPGEGIGLAHVRATVRRLNGSIACESRLGEGSRFRVNLPGILAPAQKEQAA